MNVHVIIRKKTDEPFHNLEERKLIKSMLIGAKKKLDAIETFPHQR